MSIAGFRLVSVALPKLPAMPRLSPRAVAIGLIVAAFVWHIIYLLWNCPFEIAADEAHYWQWSRHLDWSYYSKGPLVAWIIRASCDLFGSLSQRLCGSDLLALRLPATFLSTGSLIGLYVLTVRLLSDERKALAVVATALTLPPITAGATLMTIDAPFTCAWVWALIFTHAAIFRGSSWSWLAAGLAIGIGILAKYTMVLLIPCIALFLWTSPDHRSQLRSSGFWLACLIAGCCTIPIVIWNMQHDWITLRHVSWQSGSENVGIRWLGPLRFVTEQAGLLLFFWFGCWAAALWIDRPGHARNSQAAFLWWTSVPVFALFLAFSFRTPGQLNWPIAAYVSGLVMAVDWLVNRFATASPSWRRLHAIGLAMAIVGGIVMTAILHYPATIRPVLALISGKPTKENPLPMRRFDPTARLRGWRCLASAVDDARIQLALNGEEPLIAGSFWTIPGPISFYGVGHPDVYCFGAPLGQRLAQCDLWRPNPLWDPKQFRGATVIFVGDMTSEVADAFESVGESWFVEYTEAGRVLAYWQITVCRGYRGFGPPTSWCGGTLHF